ADQGSQQLQGEAGEEQLESMVRGVFPMDETAGIGPGVIGAEIHQVVLDARGMKSGAILWECKNAKHWSDAWVAKLKADQRSLHADVAVIVTTSLPKGCSRFAMPDGVIGSDLACAATLA